MHFNRQKVRFLPVLIMLLSCVLECQATSVLGNNFRTTNATGGVVQLPPIAADDTMCVTLKSKFVTTVGMDTAASRLEIVVRGTLTATLGKKYATTNTYNKDIFYILLA